MHDFLVVGAGSAGCVLANRLSSNPGTSVLLLEAGGPDDSPYMSIPAFSPLLQDSPHDWGTGRCHRLAATCGATSGHAAARWAAAAR